MTSRWATISFKLEVLARDELLLKADLLCCAGHQEGKASAFCDQGAGSCFAPPVLFGLRRTHTHVKTSCATVVAGV